jgi:hypothetical protein
MPDQFRRQFQAAAEVHAVAQAFDEKAIKTFSDA